LRKRLEATLFQTESTSIWQTLWPYALGGVAAALVLWAAVTTNLLVPDDVFQPTLQAQLQATPDGAGLVLRAQVDSSNGQVQVVRSAGDPPDGRVFELWLIAGDAAPVSVGLLAADATTVLTLPDAVLAVLPGALLAVSDEPPGGSPTGAPTGAVRAIGPLTSS
jgi:anti-sigma-K factor RskA